MSDAGVDGVDPDVATAVGFVVLGDASVAEAANAVGITQWELEETLSAAGLADLAGLDGDSDVAAEIDALIDGDT